MTIDQARAEAGKLFCRNKLTSPCAWITAGHKRAVGYIDEGFRYLMGIGDTWEEAVAKAKAKARKK